MRRIINFALMRFETTSILYLILLNFAILNGTQVMSNPSPDPERSQLRIIGNGFWNIRVPFKMFGVNIGTHMSIIQLRNGNFLIIDTVAMNDKLTHELNMLTHNGTKIEAVIAVHPFHTLAYSAFHQIYPNVKYYGTPRHLRKITEIKWAGQLDSDENKELLTKWLPDVEFRIPAGAEFFNPRPEAINHFVSVFVYHYYSKTLHVDDTLIYIEAYTWPISLILQPDSLIFHPSIIIGLHPNSEAPLQFYNWMKRMLKDWDFQNLCTAHVGAKVGGAHAAVLELVNNSQKLFESLSELHCKSKLFSILLTEFSEVVGQFAEYLLTIIT